ncbi:MAG: hypothetical protein CR979_02625, partial [Propionibacterium sp.]
GQPPFDLLNFYKAAQQTSSNSGKQSSQQQNSATDSSKPDQIDDCANDLSDIAWAVTADGWLLVCGESADEPKLIRHNEDGSVVETTQVSHDNESSYSGKLSDGGSVWVSFSPGTVGRSDSEGKTTSQTQTDEIWFAELGKSKGSKGNEKGSFGAKLPKHDAKEQVRYLDELLRLSRKARKSLGNTMTELHGCVNGPDGDYSKQIAAIDATTSNRREMLTALEGAPVDRIPSGNVLISELKAAIQPSLEADIAYGEWARAIDSGCGDKRISAAGNAASDRATAAKIKFSKRWNNEIVPAFGVAKISHDQI